MSTPYTKFKGLASIRDADLLSELENNLKMYIDWALLGMGGWIDVAIPQEGVWGGEEHILKSVEDPSYTNGQVWEGFRKDWVWESSVDNSQDPINIESVRVDGVNYASDDVEYGWHINYPLGRVIFNTSLPVSSNVQCSYSYRWAQSYIADNAPWWRELQYKSHHAENAHFITQEKKGDWSIGSHHRVQMPSIIIECTAKGGSRGFELGNSALVLEQVVELWVMAETRFDRNKLLDIFRGQADKVIWIYNSHDVINSGDYPLDHRGMRVGEKMYSDLVGDEGYRWRKCFIDNATISEVESWHPNLFEGRVRWDVEVVR